MIDRQETEVGVVDTFDNCCIDLSESMSDETRDGRCFAVTVENCLTASGVVIPREIEATPTIP